MIKIFDIRYIFSVVVFFCICCGSYAQNNVSRYFLFSDCEVLEWPEILSDRDRNDFRLVVEKAETYCCREGFCLGIFADVPGEGTDMACQLKNGGILENYGTRIIDNSIKLFKPNLDLERQIPIILVDFVEDTYGKGVNVLLQNGEWIRVRSCETSKSDNFDAQINFGIPRL